MLIEKYGEQRFRNRQITEQEFHEALPLNFIWKTNDIFTNFISDLFFNYAMDGYDAKAEAGENGSKFDSSVLPAASWTQLQKICCRNRCLGRT